MKIILYTLLFVLISTQLHAGFFSDEWLYAKYKNIEFLGMGKEREIRKAYESFYYFEEALKRIFPKLNTEVKKPFRIILISDKDTFVDLCPLDEEGKSKDDLSYYFRECRNYSLTVGRFYQFDGDNLESVYENQTYRILEENFNMKPWAIKGFAECFGTFQVKNSYVTFGQHPWFHARNLERWSLIPLEKFFSFKNSSPAGLETKYASQAWGLCHYFMFNEEPELSTKYLGFVARAGDKIEESDFKETFGYSFDEFERELKRYGDGLFLDNRDHKMKGVDPVSYYRMLRFKRKDFPKPPALNIIPAPQGILDLFLAGAYIAPKKYQKAETLLNKLIESEEYKGEALAELAQLEYAQNNDDLALELYQKAYAQGYRGGYAIALMIDNKLNEKRTTGISKDDAQEFLRLFQQLFYFSLNNESYFELYARAWIMMNFKPDDGSISGLIMAFKKFPKNQTIAFALADLLKRRERFEEAFMVLNHIQVDASQEDARIRTLKGELEEKINAALNTTSAPQTTP